eukprot:8240098-Pyramimonas_sp.AAC.1
MRRPVCVGSDRACARHSVRSARARGEHILKWPNPIGRFLEYSLSGCRHWPGRPGEAEDARAEPAGAARLAVQDHPRIQR